MESRIASRSQLHVKPAFANDSIGYRSTFAMASRKVGLLMAPAEKSRA